MFRRCMLISLDMKTRNCACCRGTGKEVDQRELGKEMMNLRNKKGISLRDMGRIVNLSAPYLSDLERGNRTWNTGLIIKYKEICK